MGYNTYITGDLRVEPALPEKWLTTSQYAKDSDADSVFWIETVDNSTVAVVDGQITVIGDSYSVVHMRWEEPFKAYDFDSDVQALLVDINKHKCVANGTFNCYGEDNQDIWRVRVEKNAMHVERPKLVWPNGDEEDMNV